MTCRNGSWCAKYRTITGSPRRVLSTRRRDTARSTMRVMSTRRARSRLGSASANATAASTSANSDLRGSDDDLFLGPDTGDTPPPSSTPMASAIICRDVPPTPWTANRSRAAPMTRSWAALLGPIPVSAGADSPARPSPKPWHEGSDGCQLLAERLVSVADRLVGRSGAPPGASAQPNGPIRTEEGT